MDLFILNTMLNLFKVTGAARGAAAGTSSRLEDPTYLLILRVSDLAVTRIMHKICTIKYTSFDEKKLKNFLGWACTSPSSVPKPNNGTKRKCTHSENSGYTSVHSVVCHSPFFT